MPSSSRYKASTRYILNITDRHSGISSINTIATLFSIPGIRRPPALHFNMRFFSSVLAVTVALGFSASATPLQMRQDTLLPFEVTAVTSSSPPGRPGTTPCRSFLLQSGFSVTNQAGRRALHSSQLHRSKFVHLHPRFIQQNDSRGPSRRQLRSKIVQKGVTGRPHLAVRWCGTRSFRATSASRYR